jgi:hypothetical protein
MLVTTNNLPDRLGRLPWNGSYKNLLLARTILLHPSPSISINTIYLHPSQTITIPYSNNTTTLLPSQSRTKPNTYHIKTTLPPTTAFTSRGSYLSSMCFGGNDDYDRGRPFPRPRYVTPRRQTRHWDDDYDMPSWTRRAGEGSRWGESDYNFPRPPPRAHVRREDEWVTKKYRHGRRVPGHWSEGTRIGFDDPGVFR